MTIASWRVLGYCAVTAGLVLSFLLFSSSEWQGDGATHTVLESIEASLAFILGAMALVRYWSKPNDIFLLLGAGFIGTAVLDGMHATVTSALFQPMQHIDALSLHNYSWLASRLLISLVVLFSAAVQWRKAVRGRQPSLPAKRVYLGVAVCVIPLSLLIVLSLSSVQYLAGSQFGRMLVFVPAALFLVALGVYLRLGNWRTDKFQHWFILFLITSAVCDLVHASTANRLYDFAFEFTHLVKLASYLILLLGLLINMYVIFVREKQSGERNRVILNNIFDGIIIIDTRGVIRAINSAVEHIFGYEEFEMTGQNVSMLAASPDRENHDQYLMNYLKTGQPKVIGSGREVEGVRKNGETFPLQLRVAEVWSGSKRMFLGVVSDNSARHEADRLKSEFVSTVSHELRTPLTAIKGSLGILASGKLTDPAQEKRMLDLAKKNIDRLNNLVNDLLDIEKMQLAKMQFRFEPLELSEFLSKVIEVNESYCAEKSVRLVLGDVVPNALVLADPQRLHQVMANLISNAVKFSPEGGVVTVAVSRRRQCYRVSVTDHGSGIPEEFKHQVFERFTQADSSDRRKHGGSGLGLNIVKMIVERHGGQIGFTSEENKETTFHFDLDVYAQEVAASPVGLERTELETARFASPQPRILVVEDESEAARSLAFLLQKSGYLTDIARSAEEAKEFMANARYDLVTVDILLPDGNGLALIRELRAREDTRDLLTIVVSMQSDQRDQDLRVAALEIVDWLEKPLEKSRLLKAVDSAFAHKAIGSGQSAYRILYVEDEEDLVKILESSLDASVRVESASTVATARRMLEESVFDLVILDVALPDGSGLDLLPLLQRPGRPKVPVIIYSASEVDESYNDQVEAAMVKSRSSSDDLVQMVENLLPFSD